MKHRVTIAISKVLYALSYRSLLGIVRYLKKHKSIKSEYSFVVVIFLFTIHVVNRLS